ncbi:MAG: hypothetical protein IJ091_06155 [Oscillospiraceae bacterium]|nr:hypothetical protein [Oscillospiraceae bacterium]
MTSLEMLDAIGYIDPLFISQAEALPIRRCHSYTRWIAAFAACLIITVSAIPLWLLFRPKGASSPGGSSHNNSGYDNSGESVLEIASLEFNGCYYEATDIPEALSRYGLPETLTSDLIGEHVSYLVPNGSGGYQESAIPSDIEMFTFAPDPGRAVYIIQEKNALLAALFCNYSLSESGSCVDLVELYRAYNIGSSDDIASITETDWNRTKVIGKIVTDPDSIAFFYNETTTSMPSFSNDAFQKMTFEGLEEEEQINKHIDFANDLHVIRIETKSGLRFYIDYHPSFGWIYGNGTLSYYRTDTSFKDWFDSFIG